jgi:hypothetical protein
MKSKWPQLAILRAASWLTPLNQRADWLQEWQSELWYVPRRRATEFCLGAFRDALWMRRNSLNPLVRSWIRLESPLQCLGFLAVLAGASTLLAYGLPGPRNLILPSPYRDSGDLAMVSLTERPSGPAVSLESYRFLQAGAQHWFNNIAYYQPMAAWMRTARGLVSVPVVRASDNLFGLLSVDAGPARPVSLVLSQAAWRQYFDSDPRVVGRVVEVAGQRAVVAAVISADSWRLPGKVEAWLIEDAEHLAALPESSQGFVVAHIRTTARPRLQPFWHIWVFDAEGKSDGFYCTPLSAGPPVLSCLIAILMTCILIPATTLTLGDYAASRRPAHWATRPRRWVFLAAKIALVMPIVPCTLVLAVSAGLPFAAQGLVVAYILVFRWVLADQRKRCPVCLRLLTNPVRIGRPSKMFLDWYGTELMCTQGHGLLHVPEIATSCYATQQWLYLDRSWSGLFTEPAGARHG